MARAAVEAGADIVNDVSGLQWDPEMKKTVAALPCGFVLMHMRGTPEEWKSLPPVADVVSLVKRELRERVQQAELAGIKKKRIVVDPGIGFGKNLEQNYPLLNRLSELQDLRLPILVGTSRKSFIAKALENERRETFTARSSLWKPGCDDDLDSEWRSDRSRARREASGRRGASGRCGAQLKVICNL